MNKSEHIAQMEKAANNCMKSCNDYSCVRNGYCTGVAGQAVTQYYIDQRQRLKDHEDAKRIRYLLSLEL